MSEEIDNSKILLEELYKLSKVAQIIDMRIQQLEGELGPLYSQDIQNTLQGIVKGNKKLPEFPARPEK